jgi:hypothetical protein
MSHNTFGHLFRVTTWGESHGTALGCVVDGCPPGIALTAEMIQGAFGVSDLIILYHKPLGQIRITASNIAINMVAGWLLIEPLGVAGAALSVLAGVLAGSVIRRHALRTHFGIRTPLHYSAGPVAAGLAAFLAGWAAGLGLAGMGPAIAIAAAVVTGFAVYAAALKFWLAVTGETLSMTKFAIEDDKSKLDKTNQMG